MVNTAMIRGKIVEKGMDVPGVAGRMGINGATLYRRLANGDSFTIGEASKISIILGLTNREKTSIFLGREENIMSETGTKILDTAEQVILRKMEGYLKEPEAMTDKDCYNFQLLVISAGRINQIRSGETIAGF